MKEVKNILVIRKHNQIGDMLCSVPLYAALKKKFPSASITLVASPTNYPIPFKEINPYIDDVFIYDKSSLGAILKFYYQLRKKKFDIGVVPSTIKVSRTSHIINFLSGAKNRVGVNSIDGVINKSASLLNIKGDFFWERDKVHQTERNCDIAKLLGCTLTEEEKDIPLRISEEHCRFAETFISDHFPSYKKESGTLLLGIHPGAGKKANIWDNQNFIEIISVLSQKYKLNLLITSGTIDTPVINSISETLNERKISFSVANNLPVLDLAAVISNLNLYITNDTGTMHIAGKTPVRQVSLFGPTHAYEWGPFGKNKVNIQSPSADISGITINDVLSAIDSLLK